MEQRTRVYVIGHRNPDTDSICSAIAYARLRSLQGLPRVLSARAGNLNRQTEFVLNELQADAPELLVDVFPRVRDVVSGAAVTIDQDAPLSQALELFNQFNIRVLPVVDPADKPVGLLVLKKVSERFLVPAEESRIRKVLSSPAAVARCLRGEVLCGERLHDVAELNLYVGAMDSATFHHKMAGLNPGEMILVTGDRVKIQREGIAMGVRVMVVTGGLPVPEEIVAQGRERGVTIITTPFDTATTSWLTRLSTPCHVLAVDDFETSVLGEKVDDLRPKLLHGKYPGLIVLDGDGKVTAVATKSSLMTPSPVSLILVDHNELSQAVPGAEKVRIIEVVDHHRLGNFHTEQPIRFINDPLGSTSTLVATLYRQAQLTPDAQTAGLLLAGLLSDTVLLKSPTTTPTDREYADWLGACAGLDPQEFGQRIFSASSALGAYGSPRELISSDFKEYSGADGDFGVGQVEVVNFQEFIAMKDQLAAELDVIRQEKQLTMAAILVSDIVQETSLLLAMGAPDLRYRIGYPLLEPHLFELKGVLSRKKQLVPHLLKVFRG